MPDQPSDAAVEAATSAGTLADVTCQYGEVGLDGEPESCSHTYCYYAHIAAAAYAVDMPIIRAELVAEIVAHPMLQGEGVIPKANVRTVISEFGGES